MDGILKRTTLGSIGFFFLLVLTVIPAPARAATSSFEISGWIPYWRTATGTADVLPHLSQLTEINPFGYTIKKDGSLYDAGKFTQEPWTSFFAKAREQKLRVIPTVMSGDTEGIYNLLKDPKLRAQHVKNIVTMVNDMGFDGVDIDYEAKSAETKPYFSAFLKELYTAMGKKWVMCTIEARTPVDSRYLGTPPADATTYANDLVAINKYCDRVRIMAYDQQFVDQKLVKAHQGTLYAPIADPNWVTKVVTLMKKDISPKKIEIGIATYGYDYQVIPNSDGSGYSYTLIEAFNPKYALDTAGEWGITPTRNSAGEMSFSYVPSDTSAMLPSQQKLSDLAPSTTNSSNLAAAGAIAYLKLSGRQAAFHLLWWSDAKAIADKIALAKKLGVRGVAIFKFDGGEDQAMWALLKK